MIQTERHASEPIPSNRDSSLKVDPSSAGIDQSYVWNCKVLSEDWLLVMQQDDELAGPANEFFSPGNFEMNPTSPKRRLHSIMNDLSAHATCDGRFHFRMVWPELGFYNEWFQASDPTSDYNVAGFQGDEIELSL